MVQDWLKFTRKQPEFRRIQILEAVEKIEKWDLKGLDIAPAVGYPGFLRCRIGSIRIIFSKNTEGKAIIEFIGNRGDIYKHFF